MEIRKTFSLNLIFLLALNILVKPVYLFGIEVGVQNAVGASEYGLYYAMLNFTFLFNVLLDLGINNYQKVMMAQDEEHAVGNLSSMLSLKVILAMVYVVATVILGLVMGYEGRYWFFIGWLMLNHVLSIFLLYLRANLSGLHLFFRDSLISIVDRSLMVLGIGYILWFGNTAFQIEFLVIGQTLAYIVAILLALLATPAGKRFTGFSFDMASLKTVAYKTWPFGLLILLMTIYHKVDGIMLEQLATDGLVQAGVYAQAYRILDAGNSFAFLYAGLLLPMFSRLIFHQQNKDLAELVTTASRFLIVPAGVVFIIVFFQANYLMDMLYDMHADDSSLILKWLMGSFVFIAVGYVFGTLITASQNMKLLNTLACVTALTNVGLNWVLIPEYGGVGAAIASFISLGVMALGQIVFSHVHFKLPMLTWLWRAVLLWALVIGVEFVLVQSGLGSVLQLLIAVGVSILGFLAFVMDWNALRKMFDDKSDTAPSSHQA